VLGRGRLDAAVLLVSDVLVVVRRLGVRGAADFCLAGARTVVARRAVAVVTAVSLLLGLLKRM
jgi:hypothetical protein